MKLQKIMAMLFMAATITCFTACSDDDDDDPIETEIAKDYTCKSNLENKFMPLGTYDTSDRTVQLKYADGKLSGTFETSIGNIAFEDIKVTKNADKYTISDDNGSIAVSMHGSGDAKSYVATLAGEVVNNELTATCKITMGGMGEWTVYFNNVPDFKKKYVGTLTMSSITCDDYAVLVSTPADGKVSVAFSEIAGGMATIAAFEFNDVAYTENADGSVTLSKTDAATTVTVDGAEKNVGASALAGTIKDGVLEITLSDFKYGNMPMTFTIAFKSNK